MKIALAQMQMSQDIESNYQKSLCFIREAAEKGAQLVMFPEIQLTPFFPQYENEDASDYVITFNHPYVKGICDVCRKNRIFSSPNLYIEENGKRYDMSFLIDDEGNIIGTQKMVHVAQCEQFYEQSYYTPSEEGFSVFDTKIGKIGIVVCLEMFQWEIRVQAFQNSVNIAMCNRAGREDVMVFYGESLVSGYDGELVAVAGRGEELLVTEIDLPGASAARNKKPYTLLRRTELYE